MSLTTEQVEVGYGTCIPITKESTEMEKIEYAICRANSACLVLRDLAMELEKHDVVSASIIRQELLMLAEVIDRLYGKREKIIARIKAELKYAGIPF